MDCGFHLKLDGKTLERFEQSCLTCLTLRKGSPCLLRSGQEMTWVYAVVMSPPRDVGGLDQEGSCRRSEM